MNAISPFSLFDTLSPGKMLGRVAGTIAESAKGQNGLAGAFSAAWDGLDANNDGALNAKDVLSHAVGARNAVLQGIADAFDYPTNAQAHAAEDAAGDAIASVATTAKTMARSAVPAAQMLIASAPPALPSAPAARAVENLPGVEDIRATYATLRNWH